MRAAQAAVSAATDTLYGCFALQRYSMRLAGNAPALHSHHNWKQQEEHSAINPRCRLLDISRRDLGHISDSRGMTYSGGTGPGDKRLIDNIRRRNAYTWSTV